MRFSRCVCWWFCKHTFTMLLGTTTTTPKLRRSRLAALKREEDSIVKERDTLEMAKMRPHQV